MELTEVMLMILTVITVMKQGTLAYPGRKKLNPVFLPAPTNVTTHLGNTVVLQCHVRDLGTKMVVWRRKESDIPITIGEAVYAAEGTLKMSLDVNHTLENDVSYWNLIIKDVTMQNAGTYLCQITASKLYIRYVTLEVLDFPELPKQVQKAVQLTGSDFVNEFGQINLRCVATGITEPPDDIDWFFKGDKITSSKPRWAARAEITKYKQGRAIISTVIVDRARTEDGGNYVCRSPVSADMKFDSKTVHVLSGKNPKRPLPGPVDPSKIDKRHNPESGNYTHAGQSSRGNAMVVSDTFSIVGHLLALLTCAFMATNLVPVLDYLSYNLLPYNTQTGTQMLGGMVR